MSPQNSQAALAALNGVRPVLSHFEKPRTAEDLAADIIDLWAGAESALQTLVGNSSLAGQQLVRAARQAEVITIDQAHSLLEFLAARDRANRTSYKPTQADGDAAVDGFKALESGLTGSAPVKAAAPASPSPVAYTPRHSRPAQPSKPPPPPQPASPYAPPSAGGGYRQPPAYAARSMAGPPTIEMPGSFSSSSEASTGAGGSTGKGGSSGRGGSTSGGASGGIGRTMVQHALAAADSGGRGFPWLPMPVWIGIVVIVLLAGGGYFFFGRGTSGGGLTAGIDAMQNGQREVARGIFAKAVNDDPAAPTPHIFLARLARGEGDLATARAQLDTALRLDPKNAIALREMGLVLFASRQYDLARRFLWRAVTADPKDLRSQGYLGCAMMRLNRVPEGTKWISGAGTGPWQACLQPTTPTTAPPPL
jgi:tetratricopeptide (TPR) repeat protein